MLLGIDYGKKRVGIAISDETESLAFPLKVILNNDKLIDEISKIIKEKDVKKVVIGESKDFKGIDNDIMPEIRDFALKLKEATGSEIYFESEFLTSFQAEQIQGKNGLIDASAASIILQSYIDKMKR